MGAELIHLADHQGAALSGTTLRKRLEATAQLVEVAQTLSTARGLAQVMSIVKHAARQLTEADGASFVLRDKDHCYYADEESISPLWKGSRFPIQMCVSGWSMMHREAAVIEDIYKDPRVPSDAYRSTYVTSLAMVPIRTSAPVGAIGIYWSRHHLATESEVALLRALADLTSVAMENVRLYAELNAQVAETRQALQSREEFIATAAHELRTPLTSLTLEVQSMEAILERQQNPPLDLRLPKRIASAASSVTALNSLVSDLLAATVSATPVTLHRSEFDLVDVARAAVAKVSPAAEWVKCPVRIDAEQALWGFWDREKIEEALVAVLSNALKFGAGNPICVEVREQSEFARLDVHDEGKGAITSGSEDSLWVRRLDSVANHSGLSLGLFKARQIVEAHQGIFSVAGKAEGGCAVSLSLPLDFRHA